MKNRKKISTTFLSLILAFALLAGGAEVVRMTGGPSIVAPVLGSDGNSSGGGSSSDSGGSSYTPPAPSKKSNPVSVKGKTVNVSGAKVAKKAQKIARKKAIIVNNAKGSVRFKKRSGNKKITVSKNGVIKIKKGLKPGTYKLRVYVTAYGNSSYKSAVRTANVKIKITTISNTMSVEGEMIDIASEDIQNAKKVIPRKEAIVVSKAKGKVTYAKKSGNAKISVNKKNGNITVAKGLAPGTYKVKVTVTAAGDKKYKKKTKTTTVTIIINPPVVQETDESETA